MIPQMRFDIRFGARQTIVPFSRWSISIHGHHISSQHCTIHYSGGEGMGLKQQPQPSSQQQPLSSSSPASPPSV